MDCRRGLGTPNVCKIVQFGLQMQKLWVLQGLDLIKKEKQESSNIRPTYVQTLHILSMNIVALTLVTNLAYHQTLKQAN
jgi:hypothetical protein